MLALAALFALSAPARAVDAQRPAAPSQPVGAVPSLALPVSAALAEPGLPGTAGLPAAPSAPDELQEAAWADDAAQARAAGAYRSAPAAHALSDGARDGSLPLAAEPGVLGRLAAAVLPASILPQGWAPETPGAAADGARFGAAAPAAPAANAHPEGGRDGSLPLAGPRLIDRLRADVPQDGGEGASAEQDAAAALQSFDFKAGGSDKNPSGSDDSQAPAPSAARGRGKGGVFTPGPNADDGGGDKYPRDTVIFHDNVYPSVAFRPNMPVEPLIISAIESAQTEVYVALYEFKLPGILDALRAARERGVKVHIILDYSQVFPQQEQGSDYDPKRSKEIWALLREGFDVKVLRGLGQYGINHNKFLVVDPAAKESMVEFGSYNWAWTAENTHYENANFSTDKARVGTLLAVWKWLDTLAQPVAAAKDYRWPSQVPAPPDGTIPTLDFNGTQLPISAFSPDRAPGRSIEDRLAQAFGAARSSIDVSIFALRSTKIAEALLAAKQRGLKVRVIMDRGQSESEPFGPYAQWLAFHGIEVRTLSGPDPDSQYPLAQKFHHKFAVLDGKLVETGSANYTKYAAEANFENADFLDSAGTVQGYAWAYEKLWAKAQPFAAPAQAPALPTDAELEAELWKAPNPPAPRPAFPGPGPGIAADQLDFNGARLPTYAFRPDTPIAPLLVNAIHAAKKSLRLALYEFNLEEVMDALRDAKKRGLTIQLVIDRSHVYTTGRDHTGKARKPSPQIQALINEGFDVLILKGDRSGIQHNKYSLIDAELKSSLVEFGSYNYATTAEDDHFENANFSMDKADVADYLAYFNYQRALAKPVDHAKLQEVLAHGLESDTEEDSAPEQGADGPEQDLVSPEAAGRGRARKPAPADDAGTAAPKPVHTSKLPTPPASTAPPIAFNGEQFARHYFSPHGGIEDAWVRAVRSAKESIDMAVFAFWSENIAVALDQAVKDNPALKVRLLLDAGQAKLARIQGTPALEWFTSRGFDVQTLAGPNEDGDPMFEKQHNKFLIVDGKLLLTGSFNPSPTAENNSFENENVFDGQNRLAGFVDYFVRMWREAQRRRPADKPTPGHGTPNGA